LCEGQVVVITGAGNGIGRAHAHPFARHGAKVVVNDLGSSVFGDGASKEPAQLVVDEIIEAGGQAVANTDDVGDFEGARRIIETAVDSFGRLDVVVNNAGVIRSNPLVDMDEADWDTVIRVHLKGVFSVTKHAANHWQRARQAGDDRGGLVVNVSSAAGLYPVPGGTMPGGRIGHSAYAAAKAGIAAFSLVAAADLAPLNVRVVAVAPGGRGRTNTEVLAHLTGRPIEEFLRPAPEGEFDPFAPENNSQLLVWLASTEGSHVTGQVFETGAVLGVAEGWRHGPRVATATGWEPTRLGPVVSDLLARSHHHETMGEGRDEVPVI
jgi:NAD(P)-dependent dehydrogenase (short-subunit alcohol dehydrogenase family)